MPLVKCPFYLYRTLSEFLPMTRMSGGGDAQGQEMHWHREIPFQLLLLSWYLIGLGTKSNGGVSQRGMFISALLHHIH